MGILNSLEGVSCLALQNGELNPGLVELFVKLNSLLKNAERLRAAVQRLQTDSFTVKGVAILLAVLHRLGVVVQGLCVLLLVFVQAAKVKQGSAELLVDGNCIAKTPPCGLELALAKLRHAQVVPSGLGVGVVVEVVFKK